MAFPFPSSKLDVSFSFRNDQILDLCLNVSRQQFWHHGVLRTHRDPDLLGSVCRKLCKRSVQHVLRKQRSSLNQVLVAPTLTVCGFQHFFPHDSRTYSRRCSSGLYSRPREKLIPWTIPMMMGCQATRYLSQSSSCPYKMCVFSQLARHEGIKEKRSDRREVMPVCCVKSCGKNASCTLY